MSTKLTLVDPTNDEISVAVAEHVAGWKRTEPERGQKKAKSHYLLAPGTTEWGMGYWGKYLVIWRDGKIGGDVPPFATSAAAVLPLLKIYPFWETESYGGNAFYKISLSIETTGGIENMRFIHVKAVGNSLALAACLALLRAHGVEVSFTK